MNAFSGLNKEFALIRDRVRGVALGHHTGFYLFGPPGTSKTHTVVATLRDTGARYFHHKGHITPLGLFDLLREHKHSVIVLDDVSAIFEQKTALQVLLAALGRDRDGSIERTVRYRRRDHCEEVRFTGGIVAISNLHLHDEPVLNALKSRVHYHRYDPPEEYLAGLMRHIASKGWPAVNPRMSPGECEVVAEFLIEQSRRLGVRLDLRNLVDKAFPDFVQFRNGQAETHWKDLILTGLEEQLSERTESRHPPTRARMKESEQHVVENIVATHRTRVERVAAWTALTGKSERAFYRRLAECQADKRLPHRLIG